MGNNYKRICIGQDWRAGEEEKEARLYVYESRL